MPRSTATSAGDSMTGVRLRSESGVGERGVIEIRREMGEYVAWAPDCLLMGFGPTEEEARADLLLDAAESYDVLRDYLARNKLSRHLAATIPAIAQLLALETGVVVSGGRQRKKLLNALKEAQGNGDTESAHGAADDALIEFINDPEVKVAYEAVPKWYA